MTDDHTTQPEADEEFVHVRVRDTGAKGSIRVDRFDPEIYEKTGDDPRDHHGDPKPWKPKTTVDLEATSRKSTQAAKKAAATGQSATTPKES